MSKEKTKLLQLCQCGSGWDIENCDCDFYLANPYDCDVCRIDPCECFDDICCYDPRYTGEKGTCRCADYALEMQRQEHWFFKRFDFFYFDLFVTIKHRMINPFTQKKWYFFHKTTCEYCKIESMSRKWKELICPKCGEENLPF